MEKLHEKCEFVTRKKKTYTESGRMPSCCWLLVGPLSRYALCMVLISSDLFLTIEYNFFYLGVILSPNS